MYIVIGADNKEYGPADLPTLQQWVRAGSVLPEADLIDFHTGQRVKASQVPALRPLFFLPAVPLAVVPAAPLPLSPARKTSPALIVTILVVLGAIAVFFGLTGLFVLSLRQSSAHSFARASYHPTVLRAVALDEWHVLAPVSGMAGYGPIYFVPLGKTPPSFVEDLARYYDTHLGLKGQVMPAILIPDSLRDPQRGQVPVEELKNLLKRAHGTMNPDCLIGIADCDMYSYRENLNFLISKRWTGLPERISVISTARLDPAFYGAPEDPELLWSRLRKMTTRSVGFLYYDLPESSDPRSPLHGSINGTDDLDRRRQSF